MSQPYQTLLLVVASLGVVWPTGAEPQEPREVSAGELAVRLRAQVEEENHLRGVLFRLVQVWGPSPHEEIDALADSLVAVAVDYSQRSDEVGTRLGQRAAAILSEAAHWQHLARGEPYGRAGERLLRLAYDLAGGSGVVVLLARLPDRAQGLAYLEEIATSTHRRAGAALNALIWYGGADGLALLRRLHDGNLVKEPHARRQLQELARRRDWDG